MSFLRNQLQTLMADEFRQFEAAVERTPKKSFRVNTLKASVTEIKQRFKGKITPLPWCDKGFWFEGEISDSIEHYLGLIYIQEAASMIAVEALKPQKEDVVWDMAAAPGSKTTQLAAEMQNSGCILANDADNRRLNTLRFNLNKMGVYNSIVSQADAAKLRCSLKFDRILVDAPCSNTGRITEDYNMDCFSQKEVKRKALLQKKLIDAAEKHLKPEGVLVYSTCSLTVEENEAVVDYAVKKHGFSVEKIRSKIKVHEGALEYNGERFPDDVADSMRIYPHDNGTGGFFAAKMRI